jgi:uncharacterized protein (UPF0210 family)
LVLELVLAKGNIKKCKKNPGTEDALFPDSEEEVLLEKVKSATLFTLSTAK